MAWYKARASLSPRKGVRSMHVTVDVCGDENALVLKRHLEMYEFTDIFQVPDTYWIADFDPEPMVHWLAVEGH